MVVRERERERPGMLRRFNSQTTCEPMHEPRAHRLQKLDKLIAAKRKCAEKCRWHWPLLVRKSAQEKLPLPKDLPRKGRRGALAPGGSRPSSRRPQRRKSQRPMEEEEPNRPAVLARRGSEDMVLSALPWEPPTDPASLADYQAMRVQWTSSMLASKLSAAGALRPDDTAASDTAASPVSMSPTSKPLDSPSPVRERSHHASRPALLISPDSSRRNSARGGARLNSLRAPLGNLMALSVESGSCDDFTARSNDSSAHGTPPGRDRRDLAVAVPPRPTLLSRPGSGPTLIVGSRPSSHCSSRPSSAASSVASSSRPSSASHGYRGGVPTPGATRRPRPTAISHQISHDLPSNLSHGLG